jgi:hypothetical protein
MSIAPDAYERSRAAVAVSCLRWLQCTGPAADPGPARMTVRSGDLPSEDSPPVRGRQIPEMPAASPEHPLWDRWLDG